MWVSHAPTGAFSFGVDFAEACVVMLIAIRAPPNSIFAALLRGHAAVDGEDRAGGEPAFVAREKQDAGGDLFRSAQASQQLARGERVAHRVRIGALPEDLGEIGRVDRARRHGIATDPVVY